MKEFKLEDQSISLMAREAPWDTAVFGYPVAQITEFSVLDALTYEDIKQKLQEFERWLNEHRVRLASVRLQADKTNELRALTQSGFYYIETVLHPILPDLQKRRDIQNVLEVERVQSVEKLSSVKKIASSAFSYERYHVEPSISNTLANKRYENWVISSHGRSEHDIYAIYEQKQQKQIVAFFITEKTDHNVYWHLTAVAPSFQGGGMGYKSWMSMLSHHQSDGIHQVATTISSMNIPVLNLYSKLNFRFNSPEVTLHWTPSQ